jgi:hypothetical protein
MSNVFPIVGRATAQSLCTDDQSWENDRRIETQHTPQSDAAPIDTIDGLVSQPTEVSRPTGFLDALAIVGDTQMQLSLAEIHTLWRSATDHADRRAHRREQPPGHSQPARLKRR